MIYQDAIRLPYVFSLCTDNTRNTNAEKYYKKEEIKIINHTKGNTMLHICETTVLRLILKGKHSSCLDFQFKFCENVQNLNTGISRTDYLGSLEAESYQQ